MLRDFFIGFINFYKSFFFFIVTTLYFFFYLIKIILNFFFYLIKNYFFNSIELLFTANIYRFYFADYFLIWLDKRYFIFGTCVFLTVALPLIYFIFKLLFLFFIHTLV